jgi:hypothetical protein
MSNQALDYLEKVAPHHDGTGCDDSRPFCEARFAPDDFGGCYRCTILEGMRLAVLVERGQKDE